MLKIIETLKYYIYIYTIYLYLILFPNLYIERNHNYGNR